MSIAQAQAMKKARLDIEELQRQVAALTARFRDLDDLLLMGQKADPWPGAVPMEAATCDRLGAAPTAEWVKDQYELVKAGVGPLAWTAEPPPFDPYLIYNITPDDVGPPIFRPEAIVSANIASPPKKRGRPPKA